MVKHEYMELMWGEFDHLLEFTDPTKAAVDVGASWGTYGLTLSSLSTKCLCIEPLKNYPLLANALPDNCIVRTVAAGDKLGEGVLRTPDWDYGLSSLLDIEWTNPKRITEQTTRIEKLDDIVNEALPDVPIGFVKIDTEGYEIHVLRGTTELLQKHRPTLQIEIWNLEEVRELLEELGYRGLFFFDARLHDIGQLNPEIHRNPDNAWSPEKSDEFDADLFVVNAFFIPK